MKTLKEQQAEAWRLAPDDAKWIAQDANGKIWWYAHKPTKATDQWNGSGAVLHKGEINGWNWRDTLQSREEFEAMVDTCDELPVRNAEWKDGLPAVGAKCLASWLEPPDGGARLPSKVEIKAINGNCVWFWSFEENDHLVLSLRDVHFEPIKSEADKLRDEQIEKIYKAGDGGVSEVTAEIQYAAGCRMTRELTPEVIEHFWSLHKKVSERIEAIDYRGFAKAIAAYVRGESEL